MEVIQRGMAPIHAMLPARKISFFCRIATPFQSVKYSRHVCMLIQHAYWAMPWKVIIHISR